jgi:DNA ligase 1
MRAFAALYEELDTTTATTLKVAALVRYFRSAAPADAAWAAYILSGHRLKRCIGPATLYRWLIDECELPSWLIDECRHSVGDLAETIALLMQGPSTDQEIRADDDLPLALWIEERLLPLRSATDSEQRAEVIRWWRSLPYRENFILNKLLTGALRVGVSSLLVSRALSEVLEMPRAEIVRRLMGDWQPSAAFWASLSHAEAVSVDPSAPYPFMLASNLEVEPTELGECADWLAEWKWDGIRCQLIRRNGQCFIWSRGEAVVTESFPEIVTAARVLPEGTVLDGELVAFRQGSVLPFARLQQRIGRKRVPPALLASVPVRYVAFDVLEEGGTDVRGEPLRGRRARLERLLSSAPANLQVSPAVDCVDWSDLARIRQQARERCTEGLVLKALDAPYGTGRQRGPWWKWKVAPYVFDAVLLYAQPGHGRRSNLFTDYTFGVWRSDELVPVAKAYSGLTDREILQLDRWIRSHTQERFGPVRQVEPSQVFELAYEGIAASSRHKSGIALRFPRIARRRPDKPANEANTLEDLQRVLSAAEQRSEA